MNLWDPITEPIDRCLIGGVLSPGLCDIAGADSPRNWDERQGPGLSGSIVVFRGVMLSHFGIKFRLCTPEHWIEWDDFAPVVMKPPYGKRPKALDIVHPLLEPLGIRAIVIENVGAPEQTSDGEWTIELKVIEYRRPHYALSTPDGAQQTPVDPYEAEAKANREYIAKLVEQLAGP
jgi:hypothetical protein